jgi:hypothetical protein
MWYLASAVYEERKLSLPLWIDGAQGVGLKKRCVGVTCTVSAQLLLRNLQPMKMVPWHLSLYMWHLVTLFHTGPIVLTQHVCCKLQTKSQTQNSEWVEVRQVDTEAPQTLFEGLLAAVVMLAASYHASCLWKTWRLLS